LQRWKYRMFMQKNLSASLASESKRLNEILVMIRHQAVSSIVSRSGDDAHCFCKILHALSSNTYADRPQMRDDA
jgi:hypothetical protein